MEWNWQRPDWPHFTYDSNSMTSLEAAFLADAGRLLGTLCHLSADDRNEWRIDLLSDEAVETSRIEGEILDRASVQSSLQRNFGIAVARPHTAGVKERGIADLLTEVYRGFGEPLTGESLQHWHTMLMRGQLDDHELGCYRPGGDPMRIVSGDPFDPEVHFEAPPSSKVPDEMTQLIGWFNATTPTASAVPLPALARAALAHLRFESIHPFSDGNGRIGRALSLKALSQALGHPVLIALSATIEAKRKDYYAALAETRFTNEVSPWVGWFGGIVMESIADSRARIEFLIHQTRFFDRHQDHLNPRQEKVLRRMFRAGPGGFQGGLSAGKYERIARTSPATARRDLGRLVSLGVLRRTGERKGTRYHLVL